MKSTGLRVLAYSLTAVLLVAMWGTAHVLASGSSWWVWNEPGGVQVSWLRLAFNGYAGLVVAQAFLRLLGSRSSYWHVGLPLLAAAALMPALLDVGRAELSFGLTMMVSMTAIAVALRDLRTWLHIHYSTE